MITLKTIAGTHIVTVDGERHEFPTMRKALEFIMCVRQATQSKARMEGRR